MKNLILSLVCVAALVFPLAATAEETFEQPEEALTPLFSAGIGLGYNDLIPLSTDPSLALFNLRMGGYGRTTITAVGNNYLGEGSLGFEFGLWTLMLPADRLLVMVELPMMVSLQYTQKNGDSYSFAMGYCPLMGYGEQFEVNHSIALNCRYEMGIFFFHAGFLLPMTSLVEFRTMAHLAAGFCF